MTRKSLHRIVQGVAALALVAVMGVGVACGDGDEDGNGGPEELSGGILVTFETAGEQFKVWVTNPQAIEDILALRDGTGTATIPNGAIREGPGLADHNAPWNWHLDPEDIEMAEFTMELCDGAPWFVEEELDYFIETVGRYCPWSAELVSIEDYR